MNELAVETASARAPTKFRVTDSVGALHVSWRWFRADAIVLLLLCIGWDAGLVGVYRTLLAGSFGLELGEAFLPLLIATGHVLVGAYLTYYALTSICNRTTLGFVADPSAPLDEATYRSTSSSRRSGTLTVHHGPLPWPGNVTLQASDIRELVLAKRERRRRSGAESFDIVAIDRQGRERVVVAGLDAAEATHLHLRLARALHAPFVAGETEVVSDVEDDTVGGQSENRSTSAKR